MNLKNIFDILKLLVDPFTDVHIENDLESRCIKANEMLSILNLYQSQKLKDLTEQNCNFITPIVHTYTMTNLKVLYLLVLQIDEDVQNFKNMAKNTCSPETLNFEQEKLVGLSVHLSIILGISPLISNNIDSSIGNNSSISYLDKLKANGLVSTSISIAHNERCTLLKYYAINIGLLLFDKIKIDTVKKNLIGKHLNDILCLFIEVCYCPSVLKYLKTYYNDDYIRLHSYFQLMMESINQGILIRWLIILQSGQRTSHNCASKVSTKWFRKCCLSLLQKCIMNKNGLKALILALMHEASDANILSERNIDEADWKKSQSVATIVTDLPVQDRQLYYFNISIQILDILDFNEYENEIKIKDRQLTNILIKIISLMFSKDSKATEDLILNKIFSPFILTSKLFNDNANEEHILINEKKLSNFINFLEKVFFPHIEPNSFLLKPLNHYLDYFFQLYDFTRKGISHLRSVIEKMIFWMFDNLDTQDTIDYLYKKICPLDKKSLINESNFIKQILYMPSNCTFKNADSGAVELISYLKDDRIEKDFLDVSLYINLISNLKNKNDIAIDLIILLLKKVSSIIYDDIEEISVISGLGYSASWNNLDTKIFLFELLAALSEKFDHINIDNRKKIISLAKLNLERGVAIINNTDEKMTQVFMSETLTTAMGLLTAVFSERNKLTTEDWSDAESLLPLLHQLSVSDFCEEVREMALDLKIALATHGIFSKLKIPEKNNKADFKDRKKIELSEKRCSEFTSTAGTVSDKTISDYITCLKKDDGACNANKELLSEQKALKNVNNKILIEELSSTVYSKDATDSMSLLDIQKPREINENSILHNQPHIKEVLDLLSDPSVPARGHALILLKRLIDSRHETIIKEAVAIYEITRLNLVHDDSYIYLNAILVVASLGDVCPDLVVARVANEYCGENELREEVRLKIGEILMKIVDKLGIFVPKYRNILLSSVLSCIHKYEGIIRASGVSNLAQICHYLHFSLGSIINEVLECVGRLVKFEKHVETRRAAVLFITQLLRGLSDDVFQVLGDKLLELYRVLKYARDVDTDDIVQLHIQLSIQELDCIIKKFLTPQQSLIKNIYVLDYPSNN